ncbi:uncharacterized protein LY89DRAFT_690066 [Mollisia scopiformis]|uniref:Zn(2)-C6 fungal-type domain-containing protein n=1 Tax=Mollisia scopiformis TaxID=149040 RepID=A0A132BB30_MOLSC|nr:uncharacterized protein LY89DRAFT_690066 [Mollisia scopiformis]KUJ09596.1 hypothetical protein LY89DRAFT_690066 [Mollisia scopiformis]
MMPQGTPKERFPKGCNPCRGKKQKCDESKPLPCGRCVKTGLSCSWPGPEKPLPVKRRGAGSWKSRAQDGTLMLPDIQPSTSSSVGELDAPRSTLQGIHADSFTQHPSAFGGSFADLGYEEDEAEYQTSSNVRNDFIPRADLPFPEFATITDFANISPPNSLNHHVSSHWASLSIPTPRSPSPVFIFPPSSFLSDNFMTLPNSLRLSDNAHRALGHYQTTFSIYRTTKDPKWSTHKLLLDLGAKSTMIMRFIIAVAINDVCHRQDYEASLEAQEYFEKGAQELIEMIQRDSDEDFVMAMAGFLFLYWYMPKRKSVPRARIQQLSMTVLTYLKRHKLDSRCLESDEQEDASDASSGLTDRDRSILARIIICIFDEDVKCGFQGAGGCLARYLTAHRERTMAVYEVSRTVLKAYWGTSYPDTQTDDDDYNAMELEFLWALTALWQDINQLSQDPPSTPSQAHRRVEQRFKLLEKKYSSVFQKSAAMTQPRAGDRVLINADYDVVLFHSLRVYYFRAIISDSNTAEIPQDIKQALDIMLDIIQRTFASKSSELHDRLQWPLFLAGIETDNGLYRKAIMSSITSRRAREALQKTIDHQTCSGKRLAMSVIKALLCESDVEPVYSFSSGQDSFLDTIVENVF